MNVCETLYLYEAAHHILVKHRQAGPALPKYVQSVYRHDNRLLPRLVHQQNDDAAIAQAQRVVRRSEEKQQICSEKLSVTNLSLTHTPHTQTCPHIAKYIITD